MLLPFLSVVMTSLAGQEEINEAGGFVLWAAEPTLNAYRAVLSGGVVTQAMIVSIGVTAVGTAVSLLSTIGLAYGLSRPGSLGHGLMLRVTLFTLFFTPGIIPMYLLVQHLGLIDQWAALILPVMVNAFNVIVMRSFFLDMPGELIEAAKIDGASEFATLVRIVLPLSRAVVAVVGLFYAVAYWNAFFTALLYIQSPEKWPLSLVLRTFVVDQTPIGADELSAGSTALPPQTAIQTAIIALSVIPVLVIYPFLQKHFRAGLLVGGVKG
ncbi:carbohydrate ABC transporter permease [Jiangella endophytica]|uniref:carbohydrate ABC transporter permease n=1 Tax=Jiangella endophytica TaxID=1623398 RepID=UPI0018E55520|nr:carbohydrate ABC transporter permease [Jiangella endophytica]